ncbi:MAG: hypothetical protein A2722_02585 [Candidatus Doudnabacteria bacterium RIFCSPHIGHO2_01_FULL_50_11]|uniref:Uncharacterized protein n=1 Tax=Candidatus Doudnabacteria bacterium RIFCSPHIGHO2_01_FULL_50_11 TaxID=1817828 RepID=A0A1F5PLH0_9BACT|nr:MAG: hypothetical protein A2722_02585 [Candidatus Doudnabacteria bacterium RIFCSPHIGHO2_01_FULL_50_11]HLC45089.1 hypothetical protein [Patescibacteria group bacterium]
MDFQGTIIKESLSDIGVLKECTILRTDTSPVTEKSATPWLDHWTLHRVKISEDSAERTAGILSKTLDYSHGSAWYADFKNDAWHYIIFKGKIFKVPRKNEEAYREAKAYGLSLGIPEYQLISPKNI